MDFHEAERKIKDRVSEALSGAVAPELVTKWVVVAEVIGENGHPGLWIVTPDGMHVWDNMGLLTFALAKANADAASEESEL